MKMCKNPIAMNQSPEKMFQSKVEGTKILKIILFIYTGCLIYIGQIKYIYFYFRISLNKRTRNQYGTIHCVLLLSNLFSID